MSKETQEIFVFLVVAAVITTVVGLIWHIQEYQEHQDKERLIKDIFNSIGYGLAVFFLPLTIVAVIAIGANRKF